MVLVNDKVRKGCLKLQGDRMELGTIARALERAIGAVVEAMAEEIAEKTE